MSEQDKLLYEIEAIFYRHTETLACGYMGIRCDENQTGDDNYKVTIKEILAKVKQCYEQKELEEHEIKHIEIALKDCYEDEWCSVCDNIAKKLGFSSNGGE